MNKKLFYSATAVVVVAAGGYVVYRHVKTKVLEAALRGLLQGADEGDMYAVTETLDKAEETVSE